MEKDKENKPLLSTIKEKETLECLRNANLKGF